MRAVIPFAIGISTVPVLRFVLLSTVGAGVWSVVVGGGGYLFGHALEQLIGDIRRYEIGVFLIVAVVGALIWAWHLGHRNKSRHRRKPPPTIGNP